MRTSNDWSLLNEVDLFRGLTADQVTWVSERVYRKTVPAGFNIITAQQPGEVVYVILSGTVKIHVEQADGTDVIIALLGAGDTVGEMSLLDSAGRCASVVTLEESALIWINRHTFQECLQRIPAISNNLVRILSDRLRLANEQIQALATLDVYGRVARQLLAFAEKYGKSQTSGDLLIPIRLTQSDIADLVGASRKRVNQVFVTYKDQRYISVDHNSYITVHNKDALTRRIQ
ncbi:MAG: Crp/Fnr family transcriptional regulator [Ardenticatenales bacterium]|nr:Crp/Fnr family transcriptional regulator [Ardenticatenales bacterium]